MMCWCQRYGSIFRSFDHSNVISATEIHSDIKTNFAEEKTIKKEKSPYCDFPSSTLKLYNGKNKKLQTNTLAY